MDEYGQARAPYRGRYSLGAIWAAYLGCIVFALVWSSFASAQSVAPPATLHAVPPLPEDTLADTARKPYGICEVIGRSMFGKQPDPKREWTPLTLRTFSEGWFEPWIAPHATTGGSLRQGWANTFDAIFNRMIVGIYSYTNATPTNRDEQIASFGFACASTIAKRR